MNYNSLNCSSLKYNSLRYKLPFVADGNAA